MKRISTTLDAERVGGYVHILLHVCLCGLVEPLPGWRNFASIVLEASYEATLWAALLNAHRHSGSEGSRRVFLTCLGGGVFGNSMSWIMQAMRRAFEQFKDCDLDVRVVTFAGQVDPTLLAIEQEFAALAARAPERKRARQEVTQGAAAKRQNIGHGKLSLLPDGPHSTTHAPTSTVGESTPAGRKGAERV